LHEISGELGVFFMSCRRFQAARNYSDELERSFRTFLEIRTVSFEVSYSSEMGVATDFSVMLYIVPDISIF